LEQAGEWRKLTREEHKVALDHWKSLEESCKALNKQHKEQYLEAVNNWEVARANAKEAKKLFKVLKPKLVKY
jgi:hypothetical protein